MHNKTIAELAEGLRSGVFSSVELTQVVLQRIRQHKQLNCFVTVAEEQALADAAKADARIAKGEAGLLTGIPIAQKDIFCAEGIKTPTVNML